MPHLEWISNQVLLYSIAKYISSPGISHNEKILKHNVYMWKTELLWCTSGIVQHCKSTMSLKTKNKLSRGDHLKFIQSSNEHQKVTKPNQTYLNKKPNPNNNHRKIGLYFLNRKMMIIWIKGGGRNKNKIHSDHENHVRSTFNPGRICRPSHEE